MTHSGISAAVLIGGHSRRMGAPKALLRLDGGGDTLIERTVVTLRPVVEEIVLVGAAKWPLPAPVAACRQVADRGTSAADGIVTALEMAAHRFCIVVACDMPFLDGDLLREMGELAQKERRGVIATDAQGAHPLHAVWDRERLDLIRGGINSGERSLEALARVAGMLPLRVDTACRSERERWSVFNVNTPDDLALARAHAAGAE